MKKFILGYPVGVEPVPENLHEFSDKKTADYECDEWVEIEAEDIEKAKLNFESAFIMWQTTLK